MKFKQILKKHKKKIKRNAVIIATVFSYIIMVQISSVYVGTVTTIYMYLSALSLLLGFFIMNRLKNSFSDKMKELENFVNLNDDFKVSSISKIIDRLLKNETFLIESYESNIHQFIRAKAYSSLNIIIRFLLFISLSIIVTLFLFLSTLVSGEISLNISNIILIFQYIFIIPLIIADIYVNSGKVIYRYAKKALNYINKRNKLIYHNSKLKLDNTENFKIQFDKIDIRIDDFNKILTPFSNYIKDFELITIIGIIINIFLVINIEFFLVPFIYFCGLYLIYIREHIKTNHKIKRDKLYKQIESDLDLLAFS